MADTPDLGAAEETFNTAEAGFTEAETNFNTAQEAFKGTEEGAENYEELQTAFTEQEGLFKTATEARDTAKTAFDELKESSKKGYWPEDWRERYIDKQEKDGKPLDDAAKEKLAKRLSRYDSPRAVMDAMIAAQNKISSGSLTKIPGKDATPEELADYRKEVGIPEEATGYDLSLSEGLVIGDEDKGFVDGFLGAAHGKNYTQEQVTGALDWYYKNQEKQAAEQYEADVKYKSEAEEELREEWGPGEYKPNINLIKNFLATDFDEGVSDLISGARLADGIQFGDHPGILRGLVAKARAENPMGALVPGTGTKQHAQMVSEIEALQEKMKEGSLQGKDQDRYLKLVSLRDKVPEK